MAFNDLIDQRTRYAPWVSVGAVEGEVNLQGLRALTTHSTLTDYSTHPAHPNEPRHTASPNYSAPPCWPNAFGHRVHTHTHTGPATTGTPGQLIDNIITESDLRYLWSKSSVVNC